MKEAQTVTDFADALHSKSAKSTATTVLYGIFRSENSYLCAMTKHVQYTLLLYIRKATVYNNYRSFAVGYCSRLAQTVTDFADASHSESAKSTTTTVLYGIFSSENSYPCTVTNKVPFYGNLPIKHEKATFQAAFPHFIWSIFDFYVLWPP